MSDPTAGTPDVGTPAGRPYVLDETTPGMPYVPADRYGWAGRIYAEGGYVGVQPTCVDGRPLGEVTAYELRTGYGYGVGDASHVLIYVDTFPTWAAALAVLDAEGIR